MNGEDAAETLMAGASAAAVGTANFYRLTAVIDVLDGLIAFMRENAIEGVNEIKNMLD